MQHSEDLESSWFAVRCLLHTPEHNHYEERITIWRARDFADAIAQAEQEAVEHASALGNTEHTGMAQAYHLFDPPGHGAEVFSLIRDSALDPDSYIAAFFDTGAEHQQTLGDN